ncbi:MAG: NAD(P)H-binding protein [Streptosporangiales bacterium]|nr:NAD(P)H-binding protein [Streptosporangiales bacterium]
MMRITVFGASGGTGTEIVRQALEAGHQVTAVAADPASLKDLAVPSAGRLAVETADVTDPEAITAFLEGADAAVSAIGCRLGGTVAGGPATIRAEGIRAILSAMDKTWVRRLVAVSSGGLFTEPGEPLVARHVTRPLRRALLWPGRVDTRRMEEVIAESAADWTIMRPPRLLNRPRSRRYRMVLDRYAGARIGRADLADAVLRTLRDPGTIGHRVTVSY